MSDADRREFVGNATNGISYEEPLLFEISRAGRVGYSLPELDVPERDCAHRPRGECSTSCQV